MKEFKFYIKALYLSLFSRRFYSDLIQNHNILGIKYILFLSLIMAMPVALESKYIISNIFPSGANSNPDENLDYIEKQIPEIKIENGEVKINASTNQNILSKEGNLVAIFDVENKVDDLTSYDKIIVINSEDIRIKLPDNAGTAVIMVSEILGSLEQYFDSTPKGKNFNTSKFFGDLKQISRTPLLVIIIFSVIWYFIKYLVSIVGYSFIAGIFFMIICKRPAINFKQCFRIAVFTSTPVAFLETVSNIMGGGIFSYASLVYFLTHMIYIHFAIESYKKLGARINNA